MMDNPIGSCLDHEHDWCVIPLHEDAEICVKCGEIRHPETADSSEAIEIGAELMGCGL
jgi:hypothetical protein